MVLLLLEFLFHISRQQNAVSLSIYSIGAIEDLETFNYSRLRRNFASVICEGQCKAFVVEHSLRPTASMQCGGQEAVSRLDPVMPPTPQGR